ALLSILSRNMMWKYSKELNNREHKKMGGSFSCWSCIFDIVVLQIVVGVRMDKYPINAEKAMANVERVMQASREATTQLKEHQEEIENKIQELSKRGIPGADHETSKKNQNAEDNGDNDGPKGIAQKWKNRQTLEHSRDRGANFGGRGKSGGRGRGRGRGGGRGRGKEGEDKQ
ncbi:hypothetical protein RFI_24792, partial [Reticulomyxa filosa]